MGRQGYSISPLVRETVAEGFGTFILMNTNPCQSTPHTTPTMGRQGYSISPLVRETVAEGFGTFILMLFGLGSVAQYVLSGGTTGTSDQIRWSWGLAVMFGVYTAGGISGGHINPAVTLSMCVVKKCPWRKLLPYWIGQYLGAFLASCVIFIVYYDGINSFKGGDLTLETAVIFATFPQGYLSVWNGLADQVVSTSILVFLINAVTDPNNMAPSKGYLPVVIGLIVTAIGMTLGLNCGYAINPARDFSPRLFTLMAGWGTEVFSVNDYKYFWIPVVGPYIGGILGSIVYIFFIQMKNPFKGDQPDDDTTPEKADIETNAVEVKAMPPSHHRGLEATSM